MNKNQFEYKRRINNINHIYRIFIYFIFISCSLCMKKQNLYKNMKLSFYSEIFLIIKGNGTQRILNNESIALYEFTLGRYKNFSFNTKPTEILVNGNKIDIIDFYVYNLTLEENNITIRFNESLTDCNVMFTGLTNITYINFNNFDFSQVTSVRGLLLNCGNLISLDISTFNKPVLDVSYMFSGCGNLISVDLSNMDTSSVTCFHDMFLNCKELISLDLGNFITTSAKYTGGMFGYCSNLLSLNLSNFDTSNVIYMGYMFANCSNLISLELSNFNIRSNNYISNIFDNINPNLIYCIKESNSNNQRLINEINNHNFKDNNNCSDICFYEDKKIIFDNLTCGLNCTDINKYDYNNICFSSCPDGIYNLGDKICIENDIENSSNYINNDTSIDSSNYINNDISIDSYIDYFNNYIKSNNNSTDKESIYINIRNKIINGNLDDFITDIIEKGKEDLIIKENNIIYQITSTYNQKNNEYTNISIIDLGLCENKLKLDYNISNNTELLILKTDIYEEELSNNKIEYEVFNIETKEQLNLKKCKDIKININIPINNMIIDENNTFKLNSSHEYYNDICFPYTTKMNTDIILKDRINEYYKYYEFCPKNCGFKGLNSNKDHVICECNVDFNDIINNFKDIKSTVNINIMKCYYILFTKDGLIKNIANYIINIIIIITIILNILFKLKGYNKLILKIDEIIQSLKIKNYEKTIMNNNNNPPKKIYKRKIKNKN